VQAGLTWLLHKCCEGPTSVLCVELRIVAAGVASGRDAWRQRARQRTRGRRCGNDGGNHSGNLQIKKDSQNPLAIQVPARVGGNVGGNARRQRAAATRGPQQASRPEATPAATIRELTHIQQVGPSQSAHTRSASAPRWMTPMWWWCVACLVAAKRACLCTLPLRRRTAHAAAPNAARTVGRRLAAHFSAAFLDADDFHTNEAKGALPGGLARRLQHV
jgi:hypothetical protein